MKSIIDSCDNTNYHGGAVLADASCGHVSLCGEFGDVLNIKLDHDPEFTMSGLDEPCSSYDEWC